MTARLFVAVWPADAVLDALESLHRPEATGVRWTTREQWHVTLHFLGTCDPDEAWHALTTLRVDVATAWLGPRARHLSATVLVLPVGGLDGLAAAVTAALAGVGAAPDDRAFHGHLTLARSRRGTAAMPKDIALSASWPVTSVALVASASHPNGARYSTLGEVLLGSSTVGS